MDTLNIPTKRNLLLLKQRLALARKGHDVLDKKKHALISELAVMQKRAGQAWNDLCDGMRIALAALDIAVAEMGLERVQEVSRNMPYIPYALSETTVSLDEAVLAWNKVRELIVTWAAIENTIFRLNLQIKKTQKRANALENITIPSYEARIKYIQERLEERERDELARLKLVKERSRSGMSEK